MQQTRLTPRDPTIKTVMLADRHLGYLFHTFPRHRCQSVVNGFRPDNGRVSSHRILNRSAASRVFIVTDDNNSNRSFRPEDNNGNIYTGFEDLSPTGLGGGQLIRFQCLLPHIRSSFLESLTDWMSIQVLTERCDSDDMRDSRFNVESGSFQNAKPAKEILRNCGNYVVWQFIFDVGLLAVSVN